MSVTPMNECFTATPMNRWDVSLVECQPENRFVNDEEMSQKKGFVCLMCVDF